MYTDTKSKITTLIITIIICLFIAPWLCFWGGYFVGWISKITIGKYIVEGLTFFNVDLPLDKIPILAGVLSWISMFFASIKSNNNK